MNSNEIGTVFLGVLVFVCTIYAVRLLLGIVIINDKVEKLRRKRDVDIKNARSVPGLTTAIFEAQKKNITEKYKELINPLLRKKSYMFDVLPFLSKK